MPKAVDKTQPGAFADFLGGEEGIEDAFAVGGAIPEPVSATSKTM
jgi:hypothetical protein